MKTSFLEFFFVKLHAWKLIKQGLQHRNSFFTEHLRWLAASEKFYKDSVDISYENASCRTLEASLWKQVIDFLTTIAFCFVKYVFQIDGNTLT